MMTKSNKLTRREFLMIGGLGLTGLLTADFSASTANAENDKEMLVYIGTYTSNGKSEGIYIYKLNLSSGRMSPHKIVKNVIDPSYLTIDKSGRYLYAANETLEYEGKPSGIVSAYAIDKTTGDLTFLNKQASGGGAPCYVSVSDNGKFVLIANYVGGNAAVFAVRSDGGIGAAFELKQHQGSGANKKRQESAHAHSITLDNENKYAVVCDLGIDRAMIYRFDGQTGKLQTNAAQPFFQAKHGAGPRHFAFHPNGKIAFVVNELDSTLTSLNYDGKKGTLSEIQTVKTIPADYPRAADNTCADVHISPDGRFVYASNRGHNSLVSYKINEKNGTLEYLEHTSTLGKTPRNFAIDPTGNFLLAANQNSGSVVVFRVDKETGKLQSTGFNASVPSPVCLKFLKLAK